jgi:integrase/recombinase XerD
LSLTRRDIHREGKEAKIIGKGNKERLLFFTDRALLWLERYLSQRRDDDEALFVTQGDPPRRLRQRDRIKDTFAVYRRRAGLTKPVSPHILRHTMATTLLFNGCPIGHIKELLGHERLDTTCRYYLGLTGAPHAPRMNSFSPTNNKRRSRARDTCVNTSPKGGVFLLRHIL